MSDKKYWGRDELAYRDAICAGIPRVARDRGRGRPVSDDNMERDAEIMRLYGVGAMAKDIGVKVGLTAGAVRHVIRRMQERANA
jgi:hypothetical protein